MSLPPILANSTHTCKQYEPRCISNARKSLLYAGLALIAVGKAGNRVSVKPFLTEQRTSNIAPRGNVYQVLGLLGVVIVGVFGKAIPYLKPWTLRFGIPSICSVLATLWFLTGSRSYIKKPPNGSPLCNVVRVFFATVLKIFQPYPNHNQSYHRNNEARFSSTSCLKALHKAAVTLPGEEDGEINKWKLCSVAEVEDAKIVVRMVPMCTTFIVCGLVSSIGDTYFVEQAGKLNRSIGQVRLPIEILLLARMSTKALFNARVVRRLLKWIGRDSAPYFGIGLGMICSILCCVSAAGTERMRLKVVRRHGLVDKADEDVPMSIYWLLFQFLLLGGLDSIFETSVDAYYRNQSPEPMQGYLKTFSYAVSGLGFMSSSVSVYVVGRISERGGRPNWFQETLNKSRLDRYYWVLAALSSVNLVVFVFIAIRYRYKKPGEEGEGELDEGGSFPIQNEDIENAKSFCCSLFRVG